MQLSLDQVISLRTGLTQALDLSFDDAVVGRRLMRNLAKLNDEPKAFEEARAKLVDKYALKDETGKPLPGDQPNTIQLSNSQQYLAEVELLLKDTVSLDLQTVRVSRLPKGLTGRTLLQLDPILEDDAD